MADKVTAEDIREALKIKFSRPEWALFFEVGNGTGGNLKRWADAVSMNMYPSRGLAIVGFEIKVSRSDMQKELEQPKKAEEVGKFCNHWYLVVPKGLIQECDIIPDAWGILEYSEKGLRQTKKPKDLEAQPVTKAFVAAMLRRESESWDKKVAEEVYKRSRERIEMVEKNFEDQLKREQEQMEKRHKQLLNEVKNFETASGVRISSYTDGEELGKAVALIRKIGVTGTYSLINGIRRNMESFLKETSEIIQDDKAV